VVDEPAHDVPRLVIDVQRHLRIPADILFQVSGQLVQADAVDRGDLGYPDWPAPHPLAIPFANRMRAYGELLLTPLQPGLDPGRYVRDRDLPIAPAPAYDMENERWLAAHARHGIAQASRMVVTR